MRCRGHFGPRVTLGIGVGSQQVLHGACPVWARKQSAVWWSAMLLDGIITRKASKDLIGSLSNIISQSSLMIDIV